MRLSEIEKPSNLFVRIGYWFSRRRFGKVMSPLKVIYARKPQLLPFAMKIAKFESKQNSLDPELRLLIKFAGATANGCSFCKDIALASAVMERIGTSRFKALMSGGRDEFSPAEQAALDAVGEYNSNREVADETFARLRDHFDENQIIEIFALNAFEQFYNALTVPLGIGSDGLEALASDAALRRSTA